MANGSCRPATAWTTLEFWYGVAVAVAVAIGAKVLGLF